MFICLGTTRAQAGSAEAFKRIDHDYPLHAAQIFKASSPETPKQVLLVTSLGSNANSWFLYPQTKGRLENAIRSLAFEKYHIIRPSLLVPAGEDREKKRTGEGMAIWLSEKMGHPKSMSIGVDVVAKAMRYVAENGHSEEFVDNTKLHELAALV